MQTKKITVLMAFMLALFCCVHFASAQGYSPLVRIPGLPATGTVNLSMYLVGIYNFLLSIVGIVAVMMLIIGGMRYITAAGNSAAVGDAKDIIQNAIVGLLLALLSWVFIATINPDVLYIKKPALTAYNVYNPKCTVSLAADDPCLCINGTNTLRVALGYTTCEEACKGEDKCIPQKPVSCIANFSNNFGDANGNCECLDKAVIPLDVTLTPPDCQTSCLQIDATLAPPDHHCGWDYLVVRVNMDGEIKETDIGITNYEYHTLKSDESQIWDMFLTNNGGWDDFMISDDSYNDGINIYECAILVTARRVAFGVTGDYRNIFWVLPGTILHNGEDEFSFEKDLCGRYAQCCHRDLAAGAMNACKVEAFSIPGCDETSTGLLCAYHESLDTNNCAISTSVIGPNDILCYKGAAKLFRTNYINGILSRCDEGNLGTTSERSCFLTTNGSFRPNTDLICSTNGKWAFYK
jgi:phosphatidylglycerophosphatase A